MSNEHYYNFRIDRSIPGEKNIDSSPHKASEQVRQQKIIQREIKETREEIIEAMSAGGHKKSPYAPDRKQTDPLKIHEHVDEKQWRKGRSLPSVAGTALVSYNLKKLNIL